MSIVTMEQPTAPDKTPRWNPATLAEVSPQAIDRHFAPLAVELDLDDLASVAAG